MKRIMILLMYFSLANISFAGSLPAIPVPPSINTWDVGIIFNKAKGSLKTVTYSICEFTPADKQHQAVVCLPPFYTENIESGKYLNLLIPKDIFDAQGDLVTHYTASITKIIIDGKTVWLPGRDGSCKMDVAKNLNAILLDENETTITCEPGTFSFLAESDPSHSALSSTKKLSSG